MNRAASFLSGIFNGAQVGLGMIILGFGSVFEQLVEIAKSIGGYLGFDTSTLDAVLAGAQAFNQEITNGITENANAAAADFGAAFGDAQNQAGQAVAGPLTSAVDAAIAQAQASAAAVDDAGQGAAAAITAAAEAAEPQALKGIDSRSSEGVAEMFRLMRGGDDVQAQQLSALQQIAENTAAGDESYPFAFE